MRGPFERLIGTLGSPYGTLLVGLILTMLVLPFTGSSPLIRWVLDFLLLAVVAAALRTRPDRGALFHFLWIVGVAAVLARIAGRTVGGLAAPLGSALSALFFATLICLVLGDIFRRRRVTLDAVLGASSAFVLFGLAWASLYVLVETLQPGSFHVPPTADWIKATYGSPAIQVDLHYFSFIAMTTIGFGDIVPLTPPARGLVAIEGLLSQLFLAVVVARLVGLEVANRLAGPES